MNTAIDKAIGSSIELRSKKQLIVGFIDQDNTTTQVDYDWRTFVAKQKEADLSAIIEAENLKLAETRKFMAGSLRDGSLKTTGTDVDKILPPRFTLLCRRSSQEKTRCNCKAFGIFREVLGAGWD